MKRREVITLIGGYAPRDVNHADVCSNPARGGLNLAGALRDTLLFIVDPTNWPRSVRGLLLSGASSDFVILWTEQCASTAGT